MMGALPSPRLPGSKTTKLDSSCAHTGAPASASFSPYLWGSGADAGFPARGSRGPLRAQGSSARPPQQPRASPPQRAHCWPSTRAAGQTCRRSARSERQTWGHYIVAILSVQQVPGLQAVQEWSAAPRIAAAAALQTEAALRAVAGALDGPLEKARAGELSTRARCVPLRIAPGPHALGGRHGDWQQVPQDVLLQHGPMPAAPTRNSAVLWPVWALWCASGPKSCVFSLFPTMKKAAVVCSVTVGFFLSSPYWGLATHKARGGMGCVKTHSTTKNSAWP